MVSDFSIKLNRNLVKMKRGKDLKDHSDDVTFLQFTK